jgi:cell division septum initiation protein DivIVA
VREKEAIALVDVVVTAVAGAVKEELSELRAEIDDLHAQLTELKVANRALAARAPSAPPPPAPIPFGRAQASVPRRQTVETPKILLPEARRARSG